MANRIAIVEDSPEAYKNLMDILTRYQKEKGLQFVISYFPDAEKLLNDYKADYDLIFMDINLPYINGLDAAKKLREVDKDVALVFVTDLAQYAIKGYEVNAFDYLVKPLSYAPLIPKLDKITRLLKEKEPGEKIPVKTEDGFVVVNVSNIRYIEVSSHLLSYHVEGATYSTYGSLKDIEKKLPTNLFSRCNHCYLVNLRFVSGIGTDYVVVGGEQLKISRPKKKAFLDDFTSYLGRHS
ncbi:MAG: LytTR family DNA-binding domain-containing protein [Bacilli bacterium]|jgi:DNA-binding LytR/AlgR family response regulator|nr:LytTR family DNA-binding domain-containing protein [Bacilli bacterium]MCH4228562.1 LytTR family DNA-binding domain-containing protein [Bacilli bacterium]